jgi:hypothetical protein
MEDSFARGVCVVYTKEERVLKKCSCVLCVILKNGNMVKELIVVLCACVLLGGVESSLIYEYTKVLLPLAIVFLHFFLNRK